MRLQRNLITMKANRWYNTWNNSLVLIDQSVNWIIEYNYVGLSLTFPIFGKTFSLFPRISSE